MARSIFGIMLCVAFMVSISSSALAMGGEPPEEILTIESSTPAPAPTPTAVPTADVQPVMSPAEVKATAAPVKEISKGGLYRVRTGIFSKKESAIALANSLKMEGFTASVVSQAGLWRVQVGAFKSEKGAVTLAGRLKAKGHTADILVSE